MKQRGSITLYLIAAIAALGLATGLYLKITGDAKELATLRINNEILTSNNQKYIEQANRLDDLIRSYQQSELTVKKLDKLFRSYGLEERLKDETTREDTLTRMLAASDERLRELEDITSRFAQSGNTETKSGSPESSTRPKRSRGHGPR